MQDSEHCAITQTIHTNHISCVCSVMQAFKDYLFFQRKKDLANQSFRKSRRKAGSRKDQLDHMNNDMICIREKPAIVRNPLQ